MEMENELFTFDDLLKELKINKETFMYRFEEGHLLAEDKGPREDDHKKRCIVGHDGRFYELFLSRKELLEE